MTHQHLLGRFTDGALAPCQHTPSLVNVADYVARQAAWSRRAFGDGRRTEGLLKHIASEVDEIRADPTDLGEWIDVVILALDGAWRSGHSPDQIAAALQAKQFKNMARRWPPPPPEDESSFHVAEGDES